MRVVCLGDSNTYGYDPRSFLGGRYPAQARWVDILAELTGWEMINRGENGREIPTRSCDSVLTGETDLLIVMLGSNDILQGLSADKTAQRMEHFLEGVAVSRNQIVLIAPPHMKWGAWIANQGVLNEAARLGDAYEDLAKKLGILFLNAGEWEISLAFDGVHFDEEGHRTFARELHRFLTRDGRTEEK